MGAFVGLDVYEPAFGIPDGIQLFAGTATVGRTLASAGHISSCLMRDELKGGRGLWDDKFKPV